eukprot:jgi/Ulvmu1/1552/UM110_0015.1
MGHDASADKAHTERSTQGEGYQVTQFGAFAICAGTFGAAVAAMSIISYRRGVRQLAIEGLTEEDANRAMPYAAKALGIATAYVASAGALGMAAMHASGADLKQSVHVSSAREAWATLQGRELGATLGAKLRDLGSRCGLQLPRGTAPTGEQPSDSSKP